MLRFTKWLLVLGYALVILWGLSKDWQGPRRYEGLACKDCVKTHPQAPLGRLYP